jgi:ABC-type dipeptide/oligopeptide/nickel transport system permease component
MDLASRVLAVVPDVNRALLATTLGSALALAAAFHLALGLGYLSTVKKRSWFLTGISRCVPL